MISWIKFRENNYSPPSVFLILISFFGLFILLPMYLWVIQVNTYYFIQKDAILLVFIIICCLGIFAATYPSICKTLIKHQEDSKGKTINKGKIRFKGHHPDCDKFQSHVLTIGGKKYCPGCLGLSIGASISILGSLVYYFVGCPLIYGEISFWIGFCTVFLALFLIVFLNTGKYLKFLSNMALVIGSFLILIGLDSVKENIIIELYFIILIIIWIFTRILVSETSHEKICRDCLKESYCVYD